MSKCDFNKVALQLYHTSQITVWHGCSSVNLLHIIRTSFPKNTSGGLLLEISPLIYLLVSKYMSIIEKSSNSTLVISIITLQENIT